MEPIALTLGQKFEIEKFSREIDNSDDLAALKSIAKDLFGGLETTASRLSLDRAPAVPGPLKSAPFALSYQWKTTK